MSDVPETWALWAKVSSASKKKASNDKVYWNLKLDVSFSKYPITTSMPVEWAEEVMANDSVSVRLGRGKLRENQDGSLPYHFFWDVKEWNTAELSQALIAEGSNPPGKTATTAATAATPPAQQSQTAAAPPAAQQPPPENQPPLDYASPEDFPWDEQPPWDPEQEPVHQPQPKTPAGENRRRRNQPPQGPPAAAVRSPQQDDKFRTKEELRFTEAWQIASRIAPHLSDGEVSWDTYKETALQVFKELANPPAAEQFCPHHRVLYDRTSQKSGKAYHYQGFMGRRYFCVQGELDMLPAPEAK